MSFLGTFADLTGYALGSFQIESLVGRDSAGNPKWRIACGKCRSVQVVPHAKIAPLIEAKAVQNFQCTNGACELARSRVESETLADIRRQESREAEQAARAASEARRKAAEKAITDARLVALRDEYRTYYVHQLGTKAQDCDIVTFDRWRQLSPKTRQMVLEALKVDAGTYFRGL